MNKILEEFITYNLFVTVILLIFGLIFMKKRKGISKFCFSCISVICIFSFLYVKKDSDISGQTKKTVTEESLWKNETNKDDSKIEENVQEKDTEKTKRKNEENKILYEVIYGTWEAVKIDKLNTVSKGAVNVNTNNINQGTIDIDENNYWKCSFKKDKTGTENYAILEKNIKKDDEFKWKTTDGKNIVLYEMDGSKRGIEKIVLKRKKKKLIITDYEAAVKIIAKKTSKEKVD
jgi:hypothetical protein